jgi:hypothetical protein
MHFHTALGEVPFAQKRRLLMLIKSNQVSIGGHYKAKIYGTLNCTSGKHIKVIYRVFFADEQEALAAGFRPCGHCLREQYTAWKTGR